MVQRETTGPHSLRMHCISVLFLDLPASRSLGWGGVGRGGAGGVVCGWSGMGGLSWGGLGGNGKTGWGERLNASLGGLERQQ